MNLLTESENTYKKAVDLAERLFGKCDIKVASALTQLGTFYRAHRRFEEASECESRIREIIEGWYGGCGLSTPATHSI